MVCLVWEILVGGKWEVGNLSFHREVWLLVWKSGKMLTGLLLIVSGEIIDVTVSRGKKKEEGDCWYYDWEK